MTPQISTDPSQSKRLMTAGLSYMTADMTLSHNSGDSYEPMATPFHHGCFDERDLPSWSLSALLAMLPPYIEDYRTEAWEDPIRCFLIVFPSENGEAWTVRYANGQNEDSEALVGRKGRTLVEATVRMIETLVNKRIKLNGQ